MPKPEAKVPKSVITALQGSGFPFQTAVAHVIASPQDGQFTNLSIRGGRWAVMIESLDIVATNGHLFLTIECKKTRKEILTFLRPLGHSDTGKVVEFRCLRAEQIQDSTRRLEIFIEDWALYPKTTSSEFCVVSTSESGRDQRLLERDASLVVRATDTFARDYREGFKPGRDPSPSPACLFLPVIVTNAPIYTARYKPTEVSLESGEFSTPPKEVASVQCVRFRKAFTSDGGRDLGDRSVFIVNAASFSEFLELVVTAPNQPVDKAKVQVLFLRRSQH